MSERTSVEGLNEHLHRQMKPYELVSATSTDPRVQELLVRHGIPPSRVKLKRGSHDIGIEVPGGGFDLVFTLVEAIPSMVRGDLSEGALVLSAVFLYPAATGKHAGFRQGLPEGLTAEMTRDDVSALLGPPDSVSPVFPNDRWDRGDGRSLIVDFSEDGQRMTLVTLQISDA